MRIVIDPGSPTQREETRTIVAFGSIILDRPLTHPHPAKTPVHIYMPASGSEARRGKHQWPLYDPSVTYPLNIYPHIPTCYVNYISKSSDPSPSTFLFSPLRSYWLLLFCWPMAPTPTSMTVV